MKIYYGYFRIVLSCGSAGSDPYLLLETPELYLNFNFWYLVDVKDRNF